MTIEYIAAASPREALEFTNDALDQLAYELSAAKSAIQGLMRGPLQNKPETLLIAAQLVASIEETAADCIERIVVDAFYSERPPATNELARAAGISVTKVKSFAAAAKELPALTD